MVDKIGDEFLVNTTTEGLQQTPNVTRLSNGDFVAAWANFSEPGGGTSGSGPIRAQVFDFGESGDDVSPPAPDDDPPMLEAAPNIGVIALNNTPGTLALEPTLFGDILGSTSGRTITLPEGAQAQGLDAGTTVNIEGPAEAFAFVRNGTTLEVRDQDTGALVTRVAVGGTAGSLRFSDGGGEITVSNAQIAFGDELFAADTRIPGGDLSLDAGLDSTAAFGATADRARPADVNLILLAQDATPAALTIDDGIHAEILGSTGERTINVAEGAAVQGLDAGATVNLEEASDAFTFGRNGTTLEIRDSAGNVTAQIAGGADSSTVRFADGSTELAVDFDAGNLTFAGQSLGTGDSVPGSAAGIALDASDSSMPTFDDDPTNDPIGVGDDSGDDGGSGPPVPQPPMDDEPDTGGSPDVDVSDARADEGEALTFDVTTTNIADGAQVSWSLELSGSAAAADVDAPTSGTATIEDGSAAVEIPTIQDSLAEGESETLGITVTSPDGTASDGATGTIDDDDEPASDPGSTVGDLSVSGASATEGEPVAVRITSDEIPADDTVTWQVEPLGASASDFAGELRSSVTLGDDGEAIVYVPTVNDDTVESSESFEVGVVHASSGARDIANGTILDNDELATTGSFELSNASAVEGKALTFTLAAPAVRNTERSFNWRVDTDFDGDGFSVFESDLDAVQGQTTLPAGQTETEIRIPTVDDSRDESDEIVSLIVEDTDGETLTRGEGTLVDNDTFFEDVPVATISDAEAVEGEGLVFDIALDRPAREGDELAIGVNTEFAADTANGIAPADFGGQLADGVVFAAGQTTAQAVIETMDDDIVEGPESFGIAAPSSTIATPNDDEVTATIRDNDSPSIQAVQPQATTDEQDPMMMG